MLDELPATTNPMTDSELVRLLQTGDKEAYGILLERHRPTALGLLQQVARNTVEAADILQEPTLIAYLTINDLRDSNRFGPWLCGISLNLWRSQLRRQRQTQPLNELAERPGNSQAENDPAMIVEEQELRTRVLTAVGDLPPGARDATLLFYYRQMTVREIAEDLGISPGAVRVRLNRARIQLRMLLTNGPDATVRARRKSMLKVTVADVVEQALISGNPEKSGSVAVLATEEGDRALPIWVGRGEGAAIALGARGVDMPRPQTMSLMAALIDAAGAKIDQVRITRLEGDTFYATIDISGEDWTREVDARPSDAIALATRTHSPIFVSEDVMEKSGIDIPRGMSSDVGDAKGLDSLVREVEESFRQHRSGEESDEAAKEESYRRLIELVFGNDD